MSVMTRFWTQDMAYEARKPSMPRAMKIPTIMAATISGE